MNSSAVRDSKSVLVFLTVSAFLFQRVAHAQDAQQPSDTSAQDAGIVTEDAQVIDGTDAAVTDAPVDAGIAEPQPHAEPILSGPELPAEASDTVSHENELGAVVVTGTRRTDRTLFESNSPVDVVNTNDLRSTPSPDLNDKLMQTTPSFNVARLPLGDGAIFNRPATLRGLSPDQTLVLINGKRRHRSAYIDVTAQGAQAVDLSEIPMAAIERIEVLRDGASAQYGSDAIAGVINIILKDKPGYDTYLQYGRYYAGDGNGYLVGGNAGWELGDRGNLNLSFEFSDGTATSRSRQRPAAAALIQAGNRDVRQPAVNRFGQPDSRAFETFLNTKYRLTNTTEAYAFGNFGYKWAENDFNWRNPTQGGVFKSSQTADLFATNFATLSQGAQDWYNGNPAALSGYPGGFTPRFSNTSLDGSVVGGVRGDITPSFSWDLSGRYGSNHNAYHIRNTLNASEGALSKKAFDTGTKRQQEAQGNLDLVYAWNAGLYRPVNVAFGGEVRREAYTAGTGEPDSYAIGELGRIGLSGGANGFFGTGPSQAGTWARHSGAGYLDVDADIIKQLNLSGALRGEHYSDAGGTINGKGSARISVIDQLNLRGAVSTGFRAPTPGQNNLTNTNQFPSPDGSMIQTNGTIPPTNPIAELNGGKRLKPEHSLNINFGFVVKPIRNLTFSADAYRIDIRDRIGLSQRYTLSADQQTALVASGVPAAQGLTSYNFLVNGYKTRTQGIDFVLAYNIPLTAKQQINLTGAANLNRSKVEGFKAGIIDARWRQYIEERLPRRTGNYAVEYIYDKFNAFVRVRNYGGFREPYQPDVGTDGKTLYNQHFGAETFVDALVGYEFLPGLRLTVGAENILNNYPDKAKFPNTPADAAAGKIPSNGRKYPTVLPYSADGGRYYARLTAKF